MTLKLILADYTNPSHAQAVVNLLNEYAKDPMGGGEPLGTFARDNLTAALHEFPGAFSVLVFDGETPVGLANCIPGFSTFACRPLINIHDLMVSSTSRGKGVSQQLLAFVEQEARERRCCKVTLEVLEGNTVARGAYEKFGFRDYALGDEHGSGLLMQKSLM